MTNILYFFILGQNPTLSISEIYSRLNADFNVDTNTDIHRLSEEVLILERKEKLNCQNLQEKLGGTIKIGEIISRINTNIITNNTNITREISKSLAKIRKESKKVYFGFSLYRLDNKFKIKGLRFKIKNFALEIKKELKEKGISSRWVESKERILSSVVVQKNKLLTSGAEFCFLVSKEKKYLGRTLTCQEFEEYEFRDFGRPSRKIEKGMIPPKLAKIMINLARVKEEATILDPFCGSGTILQEAILMGYKNVIGTDLNEGAVKNSQENIKWLLKNFQAISNVQIFKTDVRNLSQKIPRNSIEAIITEPYLGPIRIEKEQTEKRIENLIKELNNLYLMAFKEFKKVLKKNSRIVIIFPVFRINQKLYFLPILAQIKKSGWQIIDPIPKNLRENPVIKLTERDSVIYSRPGQKILREIFIFKYA